MTESKRARFAGKVVLVPGATSGIGEAVAIAAAAEGGHVVVAGRRETEGERVVASIRENGGEARFVRVDISRAEDVRALIDATVSAYGRLDVACNTAASDEGALAFTVDTDDELFARQIAVNLTGAWLCVKYQLRQMLTQGGGGSIVNVSSINGLGGTPGAVAYSAAKHALIGITKTAALEYATQGIRVNVMCAGAFRTPMLERAMSKLSQGDLDAVEARYLGVIPMRRIGTPAEAAQAILWLASDEASYVTGHTMIADGGMTSPFR